jgi:hypothetical protein
MAYAIDMTTRLGTSCLFLCLILSGAGCSEEPGSTGLSHSQTNAPPLIEPNASVGAVHAGMTVAQLKAELGPPERTTPNSAQYPRLGFAVMPDADGVIQVVMCGDVTGLGGPYAKAFKGRTKEGIGMFSTREQVVTAYGAPDSNERFMGTVESMKYSALGITFTLEHGKVYHMIVRLGENPQPQSPPDNAVIIDLKPLTK